MMLIAALLMMGGPAYSQHSPPQKEQRNMEATAYLTFALSDKVTMEEVRYKTDSAIPWPPICICPKAWIKLKDMPLC